MIQLGADEEDMAFAFTCPYCHRPTTIQDADYSSALIKTEPPGKDTGTVGYVLKNIVCPNPECKKSAVTVQQFLVQLNRLGNWATVGAPKQEWDLLPRSRARQYPDYIPEAIREDYEEA